MGTVAFNCRPWLCPILLAGCCDPSTAAEPATTASTAPDLAVVVVIDQFGADLLDRWRPLFRGGLERLMQEGVVYRSAYHAHGITETCPGHATLMTGRHPRDHGIVANYWIDRETGKSVSCVSAPRNRLAHDPRAPGAGSDRLFSTTLGDWLKDASPESRVVAVAGKDRAAIMLGGHRADGVFWYAGGFGFTTTFGPESSQEYLAPVARFNALLRERLAYQTDSPAPSVLDSITLDAAEHLLATLRLGRNGVVDLLLVGLSGTDQIGHAFGTRGPEMYDHLQRLDRRLARFLRVIEATGLTVLIAVTADHGAADFPERLRLEGYAAARFHAETWLADVNRRIAADTNAAGVHLVSGVSDILTQLMLVTADGRPVSGHERTTALRAALAVVRSAPHVREAFSLDELASVSRDAARIEPELLSVPQRLALSASPQHAADILVAFEPRHYSIDAVPGVLLATHGGPYDYDRRVPMLFWWPGGTPRERSLPVASVDFAPTLAAAIGIPFPQQVSGRCLEIRAPAHAACPGN